MSDSLIRFLQDFLCQDEVKSDKLKKLRKGSLVVCLRNAKNGRLMLFSLV